MGVLADPGGPDLRVRSRSRSSTSEPCCTQTSTTKHPIQNVGNVMGDGPKTDLRILSDGYLGAGWLDVRVAIAKCATPCPFGWAVGRRGTRGPGMPTMPHARPALAGEPATIRNAHSRTTHAPLRRQSCLHVRRPAADRALRRRGCRRLQGGRAAVSL